MKTTKSEYDTQAETFLEKSGITFSAKFLFHGPHWEGDKDTRDVWELTLLKGNGKSQLQIRFGQSIANSGDYVRKLGSQKLFPKRKFQGKEDIIAFHNDSKPDDRLLDYGYRYKAVKRQAPTPYDLLACITKYDPGTFENFCGDMGLDTDSRKAEKTYFAVQEEWTKVRKFFTSEELDQLQEIN